MALCYCYDVLLMMTLVGDKHPLAHNINMKQKRMEAQRQSTVIFSSRRKMSDKRNYVQCNAMSVRNVI